MTELCTLTVVTVVISVQLESIHIKKSSYGAVTLATQTLWFPRWPVRPWVTLIQYEMSLARFLSHMASLCHHEVSDYKMCSQWSQQIGEHREQGYNFSYFLAYVYAFGSDSPLTLLPCLKWWYRGAVVVIMCHGLCIMFSLRVLVHEVYERLNTPYLSTVHLWSHWPNNLDFRVEMCRDTIQKPVWPHPYRLFTIPIMTEMSKSSFSRWFKRLQHFFNSYKALLNAIWLKHHRPLLTPSTYCMLPLTHPDFAEFWG